MDYARGLVTPFNIVAAIILIGSLPVFYNRYVHSLSTVIHANSEYPWGLLLSWGIFAGEPLFACGFIVAAAYYIFGMKEFKPFVRLAVLCGMLGYIFAASYLLIDLGRPWRIYYPMLINYGPASVLFVVAWHVSLYCTVQLLEFSPVSICQQIIVGLGGIGNTRQIHHIAAVVFTLLFVQHVVVNFIAISMGKWGASMMITLKDFFDARKDIKYYLGLSDSPPLYGRYSYKEKFTYWLLLLGSLQVIVTGYILWFPVEATYYLPGQFVPASKIIHSNEAMLIFVIIVVWHIYDSIFSPENSPLNKSIFTGYGKKRDEEA